ncbi:MAG: hypothetical protein MZV70_20370 [Desulfobacterales bacterium]|nr:hypothetical protein [Desulfobacterales bacterium]
MIRIARAAGQGVPASRPGGERRHPPLQDQVGRHALAALRDGGSGRRMKACATA